MAGRTYLDSLATLISPEGLFFVSFGIVDTGSLLLAMDEHYQLTGDNQHTLPHLRSGTQQLRLLRNMLVREDGDRLILAQAAPQHWLANGKQVAVLDAPTHFGKVSYTIDSHADKGRITVKLDPPGRTPPKAIVLHLRHPGGAKIKSVSLDGKPTKHFGNGVVTLEGLVRPARIEVHYH